MSAQNKIYQHIFELNSADSFNLDWDSTNGANCRASRMSCYMFVNNIQNFNSIITSFATPHGGGGIGLNKFSKGDGHRCNGVINKTI